MVPTMSRFAIDIVPMCNGKTTQVKSNRGNAVCVLGLGLVGRTMKCLITICQNKQVGKKIQVYKL